MSLASDSHPRISLFACEAVGRLRGRELAGTRWWRCVFRLCVWGQVRLVEGEERLGGVALILRAIDLTLADVEARGDRDREEQLQILRAVRERWRNAEEEGRG